jgi:predicted ATPase
VRKASSTWPAWWTRLAEEEPRFLEIYGRVSLHERSHGESFLALVNNRFGRDGLYLLDEPEARCP